MIDFETRVCGIPCGVRVLNFERHSEPEGSYCEFDTEIYDMRGYRAKWLERKVLESASAQDELDNDVIEHFKRED